MQDPESTIDDDELFTANSAEEMIADALGDPNWKNSRNEDDDELFTYNSAEEMIADALGDPNWKNSR